MVDYKAKINTCKNSIDAEKINIKVENNRIKRLEENLKYYDKKLDEKVIGKIVNQIMNSEAEIRKSKSTIERIENTIKHYEIMLNGGK